jgi:hypothetical protein
MLNDPNYKNSGAIYVPLVNTEHDPRDPWAGYEPTDEDLAEADAAYRAYQDMLARDGDEGD